MPILLQRAQVAAKIESVEGTAETLANTDAFLAFTPAFTPSITVHPRNPVRETLSPQPGLPGLRSAQISFDVELVGAAAAGTAPPWGKLLRACGAAETLVGGTSATYLPASTDISSITVGFYEAGKFYKIWGARGVCTLTLEAGKPGMLHFDFTGADFSVTDANLLTGVSYGATLPPIFQAAAFSIDSYAAVLSKLTFTFGQTVGLRPDVNSSSGHKSTIISDRKPTLAFDPEDVLVATKDFFGTWRAGSLLSLTTTLTGAAAGNIIAITAPKVQYETIKPNARNGFRVLDINGLLCGNNGDDEWQIAIT